MHDAKSIVAKACGTLLQRRSGEDWRLAINKMFLAVCVLRDGRAGEEITERTGNDQADNKDKRQQQKLEFFHC